MTIVNHYGFTVDSKVPIVGVINSTDPEFLYDDVLNGIDLSFEDFMKENPDADPDDYIEDEATYLIGFIKVKDMYEPNPNAEYSAIVSVPYTQIVASNFASKTQLCSPCYPGQGDLDNAGEFITYTLPPAVWGNRTILPIEEIRGKNNGRNNSKS